MYAHKSGQELLWSSREIFVKSALVIALITPLYTISFNKNIMRVCAQAIKDSAFVFLSPTNEFNLLLLLLPPSSPFNSIAWRKLIWIRNGARHFLWQETIIYRANSDRIFLSLWRCDSGKKLPLINHFPFCYACKLHDKL